jgi:hypothetical protein
MEEKMYIGSVEKVGGFELEKIGSVTNYELASILFCLLYQLLS